MKIANVQAHNDSHRVELWACRSAVFTTFEFTKCNISTEVLQFEKVEIEPLPQSRPIGGVPRFVLRYQWVNPLIPGKTYTLFYTSLCLISYWCTCSNITIKKNNFQDLFNTSKKKEIKGEKTLLHQKQSIKYSIKNWWNTGQIVK